MIGDFYGTYGIVEMWKNMDQLEAEKQSSYIYGIFFIFLSISLLISLILTINTSPGSIPDDKEWDLPSNDDENNELLEAQNIIFGKDNKFNEIKNKS